jgi:hypothetical protein
MQPLEFLLVGKKQQNFQTTEVLIRKRAMGMRAPMRDQDLIMKPEGERAWRWQTLHCLPDLILKIDAIVVFEGLRYRVMMKKDYAEYGYIVYHLLQDYEKLG